MVSENDAQVKASKGTPPLARSKKFTKRRRAAAGSLSSDHSRDHSPWPKTLYVRIRAWLGVPRYISMAERSGVPTWRWSGVQKHRNVKWASPDKEGEPLKGSPPLPCGGREEHPHLTTRVTKIGEKILQIVEPCGCNRHPTILTQETLGYMATLGT